MKTLALAALLHDIGKICYRADQSVGNHSSAGYEYLKKFLPKTSETKIILECIQNHHAKFLSNAQLAPDHFAYIVYEADNIAAGTDRRSNEGEETGFDSKKNLESIFNLLHGKGDKLTKHLLVGLGENNKINFPIESATLQAPATKYQKIVHDLESNFRRMNYDTWTANELLSIMEALTSFVPSSTNKNEICDISLYDHQKLTAAIATAMYEYFDEKKITDYKINCLGKQNSQFREANVFLMVSGDFSGIQEFIYNIPSAGALKSLRGRSFYLEMLLEHIIDEILDELNLSRANLIYTGGGHFYLLAANTEQTKKVITTAKTIFNQWLLQTYGTSLYLEIAMQECSPNSLMNIAPDKQTTYKTGDIFRALSMKISEGKMTRYDRTQLQELFSPSSTFNKVLDGTKECTICYKSTDKLVNFSGDGTKESCCACDKLFALGAELLEKDALLVVAKEKIPEHMELPYLSEKAFLYPMTKEELKSFAEKYTIKRIYILNTMQVGSTLATRLWVGNYIGKKQNKTMNFEELAQKSVGITRLGVLRADVDNLGASFVAGFIDKNLATPYQYSTLSRYATFSRQLSMFFKYYINNISQGNLMGEDDTSIERFYLLKNIPPIQRNVSIVYSGGDDVFIVGAWNELIELAVDLRRAFAVFTNNRLTFSAGIAMFSPSFPITQMARLTGLLEDNAKNNADKNSISLFGIDDTCTDDTSSLDDGHEHTYTWQEFTDKVCQEKLACLQEHLIFDENKQSDKLKVGKGLLYRFLNLLDPKREDKRINIARFAYILARLDPGEKAKENTKEHYSRFKNQIYKWINNNSDRRQLVTAINLIIYGMREKNEME